MSHKDALLEEAAGDIQKLQAKFREMFEQKNDLFGGSSAADKQPKERDCVSSVPLEQDEGYFNTYAHYGIHHEMLSVSIILHFLEQSISHFYTFTFRMK